MTRLAAAALALASLAPRPASACSPGDPVLDAVLPATDTHPANAAVIVRGSQLLPDLLSATIDGAPATLVVDTAFSDLGVYEGYDLLALRLDPAPQPGQQVVIVGEPCNAPEVNTCPELDLQFTAGPPDLTPPLPLAIEPFDVERLLSQQSGGCGGPHYYSLIDVDFAIPADILAGEVAVFYDTTADHQATGLAGAERGHIDTLPGNGKTTIEVGAIGDEFPIEGWCLTARTIDAAGNASEPVTSCAACRWYEGHSQNLFDVWTPVPGGPCDVMEDTSSTGAPPDDGSTGSPTGDPPTAGSTGDPATAGEDPLVEHGCACRHAPRAPWWLLVPLLAVRRRSHRPCPRRHARLNMPIGPSTNSHRTYP